MDIFQIILIFSGELFDDANFLFYKKLLIEISVQNFDKLKQESRIERRALLTVPSQKLRQQILAAQAASIHVFIRPVHTLRKVSYFYAGVFSDFPTVPS